MLMFYVMIILGLAIDMAAQIDVFTPVDNSLNSSVLTLLCNIFQTDSAELIQY